MRLPVCEILPVCEMFPVCDPGPVCEPGPVFYGFLFGIKKDMVLNFWCFICTFLPENVLEGLNPGICKMVPAASVIPFPRGVSVVCLEADWPVPHQLYAFPLIHNNGFS